MSDAEGIRNLVGTGLVQLLGSIVTGVLALGVLFYLNWKLTLVTLVVLSLFAGVMAVAFKTLRPLFRERGKINAEVTGRLADPWAASASSNPISPRNASRLCSPMAYTHCSGMWPNL